VNADGSVARGLDGAAQFLSSQIAALAAALPQTR